MIKFPAGIISEKLPKVSETVETSFLFISREIFAPASFWLLEDVIFPVILTFDCAKMLEKQNKKKRMTDFDT